MYPESCKLEGVTVNMVANLWNAPTHQAKAGEVHPGACTVGSTEACLLAALALKFRWREWYKQKHGMSSDEVLSVRPNLVIQTLYQAAWEKFFKYMDVEARLVQPDSTKMCPTGQEVSSLTGVCQSMIVHCVAAC